MSFFIRAGVFLAFAFVAGIQTNSDVLAQTAPCTTAGYATTYDQCSSTNPANQASTTVTSSESVQAAVAQTAGLVASRISGFAASSSAPGQALRPQSHYKLFALGNGGTVQNSKTDILIHKSKAYEATTGEDSAPSDQVSGLAAGSMKPKIGIWADAAYSRLIYSKDLENFDGSILSGVLGIDYAVQKNLLVGVAGGYEKVDLDTEFNRGSVDGSGWTVSPYAVYKVNDNYSVDISGGYSWINYDLERLDPIDASKITGDQDANRWFVSANVKADHWYDNVHHGGSVGVLHAKEDQDNFTESNATNTAGATTNVGQGYVGARLGYLVSFEGGSMEPYMRALGRYSYDDGGSGDASDAVVGLGTAMTFGKFQLGIDGSAVVGRDDTKNYTGRLNARIEF